MLFSLRQSPEAGSYRLGAKTLHNIHGEIVKLLRPSAWCCGEGKEPLEVNDVWTVLIGTTLPPQYPRRSHEAAELERLIFRCKTLRNLEYSQYDHRARPVRRIHAHCAQGCLHLATCSPACSETTLVIDDMTEGVAGGRRGL